MSFHFHYSRGRLHVTTILDLILSPSLYPPFLKSENNKIGVARLMFSLKVLRERSIKLR